MARGAHGRRQTKSLEKVQERAVRMISDKDGTTYDERLESVGLSLLRERRKRGDTIKTFKTLKGFNKINGSKLFQISGLKARAIRRTTSVSEIGEVRRDNSLYKESFNLDIQKNFYTVRAVTVWNALPDKIRKQTSINGFKNAYDQWKTRRRQNKPT